MLSYCFNTTNEKVIIKLPNKEQPILLEDQNIIEPKSYVCVYIGKNSIVDSFFETSYLGEVNLIKIEKTILSNGDTFFLAEKSIWNLNGNYTNSEKVKIDSMLSISCNFPPKIRWNANDCYLPNIDELFQYIKNKDNENVNFFIRSIIEKRDTRSLYNFLNKYLDEVTSTEQVPMLLMPMLTSFSDIELHNVLKRMTKEELKTINAALFYAGYGISSEINTKYFQDNFKKSYEQLNKF